MGMWKAFSITKKVVERNFSPQPEEKKMEEFIFTSAQKTKTRE